MPRILTALAILLILAILAASWVPDSRMSHLPWLPRWLALIADFHPQFRTTLPFIPLALVLGGLLARRGVRHPDFFTFLLCLGCVGLAEAGQLLLPARTCDWRDVICGALGALFGLALRRIFRSAPKHIPPPRLDQ